MKIKTDNIFQVTEIDADIPSVYEALMDEKVRTAFTGMAASIDRQVGGRFATWDGAATGITLYLKPNERIVQAWTHRDFAPGVYTTVVVDLEKPESGSGTRINFNHLGVPEEHAGWLTESWKKMIWIPLKEYLESKVPHPAH